VEGCNFLLLAAPGTAVKKPKRFQERQRFLGRNANYFYKLFLLFVW